MIIATTHLDRSIDVYGCTGNKNMYVKTIDFHTEKWDMKYLHNVDNNFCIFVFGNILPCHFTVFLIATFYIIHLHIIIIIHLIITRTSTMLGKIMKKKTPYTTAVDYEHEREIILDIKCILLAKTKMYKAIYL